MKDYLGLKFERQLENEIINNNYKGLGSIIKAGWEETNNASFKAWELLYLGKEEEALAHREANVMVRDSPTGLYLSHKRNMDRAFAQTISRCFSEIEKNALLSKTLLLSVQIPDTNLARKLISLEPEILALEGQAALNEATKSGYLEMVELLCANGLDPNGDKDNALKIAIEHEKVELIEYFLKTSNFKDINYKFLDSKMCQQAKTKSFTALLNAGVYLEGNYNQLLVSIDQAIIKLRPKEYKKEIQRIMSAYPIETLERMCEQQTMNLNSLAKNELKRRKSQELSKEVQTNFKKELTLEF